MNRRYSRTIFSISVLLSFVPVACSDAVDYRPVIGCVAEGEVCTRFTRNDEWSSAKDCCEGLICKTNASGSRTCEVPTLEEATWLEWCETGAEITANQGSDIIYVGGGDIGPGYCLIDATVSLGASCRLHLQALPDAPNTFSVSNESPGQCNIGSGTATFRGVVCDGGAGPNFGGEIELRLTNGAPWYLRGSFMSVFPEVKPTCSG